MVQQRVLLGLSVVCMFFIGAPLSHAQDESKEHWGAGLLFSYHYGQPVGHAVSLGVILGDASTSGGGSSGPSYEPWPSFPGGGGRGLLLQGEAGTHAFKLSAGYAEAAMLYMPPLSFGWAVKASYLTPHGGQDGFRSTEYIGGEIDLAYGARFSIGIFQALDSDQSILVTWSVGIGF